MKNVHLFLNVLILCDIPLFLQKTNTFTFLCMNFKHNLLTEQNSSKLILPSSSLSANKIVLSTICWSCVSFKLLPTIIFKTCWQTSDILFWSNVNIAGSSLRTWQLFSWSRNSCFYDNSKFYLRHHKHHHMSMPNWLPFLFCIQEEEEGTGPNLSSESNFHDIIYRAHLLHILPLFTYHIIWQCMLLKLWLHEPQLNNSKLTQSKVS